MEDLDIVQTALWLIERHKGEAGNVANLQCLRLIDAGDYLNAAVWRRVAHCIMDMQKTKPEGETH